MAYLMFLSTFLVTVLCTSADIAVCTDSTSGLRPVDLTYECINATEGSEGKAAVVLLHGMLSSRFDWNNVYETLALRTGRKVCRADVRNQGDSPWSNETSVAAMTVDVIHLLDAIGAQNGSIIGHSLGGKIAIHAALNYPERISSIVVEDMTPNSMDREKRTDGINFFKQLRDIVDSIPEGTDELEAKAIVMAHFQGFMKEEFNMTEEEQLQLPLPLTCEGGKCRYKANLDDFIDAMENDFDTLFTLSCGVFNGPALFIYGTNSEFKVQEDEENIRALFPSVELVGVVGAGHCIHGFYPQFDDEVARFLNAND